MRRAHIEAWPRSRPCVKVNLTGGQSTLAMAAVVRAGAWTRWEGEDERGLNSNVRLAMDSSVLFFSSRWSTP